MEDTKEIEAEYAEFKEFLGGWLKVYLFGPAILMPIVLIINVIVFIITFILMRI